MAIDLNEWITKTEVRRVLRIRWDAVEELIAAGKIRGAILPGRKRELYSRAEINRLFEESTGSARVPDNPRN